MKRVFCSSIQFTWLVFVFLLICYSWVLIARESDMNQSQVVIQQKQKIEQLTYDLEEAREQISDWQCRACELEYLRIEGKRKK